MTATRKVCWITGASSGIGATVAKALALQGHTVILSARGRPALEALAAEIREAGGIAEAVVADVTQHEEICKAAEQILSIHGRIDVLVANAGLNVGSRAWGVVSIADFDRLIQVNLSGVYYCIDAVLPGMRKHGGGQIINIASWAGKFASAKPGPAYTSAKTAIVALTASLNMSEYMNGIRACAISPGEVATPAMARRDPPVPQPVLDRMLQPEDVAAAVAFVVDAPARACINEIVLSPTWNAAFGAPAVKAAA
ncbi:SDR family oxidoreductase [Variovorax sp. efr-133-TYG-130]|uniref:SDR family oxidoreductase n=1 Tax=Variovorax sp. efr-133-TYG-130 TaxID=3040327 RepID=UPI002553B265|nr:SDR family oxidoreductase [Variovorax sp. efr-133-TYG-130]